MTGPEAAREAAKMIYDLAMSQVEHAVELGYHTAMMAVPKTDNPFLAEFPNKTLADAWLSGWTRGDEQMNAGWRHIDYLPLHGQRVQAIDAHGTVHLIFANPELERHLFPGGWRPAKLLTKRRPT